jgi:hypothetical protein
MRHSCLNLNLLRWQGTDIKQQFTQKKSALATRVAKAEALLRSDEQRVQRQAR